MGALYAAHAQITHQFLPHADAVIFVLDSRQPIIQEEVELIEVLLRSTKNIFFIQTKIDQRSVEGSADNWQSIKQRNEEILRDRFGEQLSNPVVWPVSNRGLRRAADTLSEKDAEVYLLVSRYKELAAAVQKFLIRLVSCSRSAEGLVLAEQFYAISRQALSGRLAILTTESKQKQAEMQERARANIQQFNAEWGERGFKRQELENSIRRVVDIGKQGFRQALQPGGEIAREYENQIDSIKTTKDAELLAKDWQKKVTSSAINKWAAICGLANQQCIELLLPLSNAAQGMSAPLDLTEPNIRQVDLTFQSLESIWDRFKTGTREMFPAGVLAGVIGTLSTTLAPLVPLALLAAVGYGFYSGGIAQTKAARDQLKRSLYDILEDVRLYFFNVDQASSRFSRVDEHFRGLEAKVFEQVQAIASQKLAEARAETQRLEEEARLEGATKLAAAERVRQQITDLDQTGKAIRQVAASLKTLEQSISSPSNIT